MRENSFNHEPLSVNVQGGEKLEQVGFRDAKGALSPWCVKCGDRQAFVRGPLVYKANLAGDTQNRLNSAYYSWCRLFQHTRVVLREGLQSNRQRYN